eukprot:TRINITY_DN55192_c0_g1_i1.p1 TRINITY_DN55192_c0_g1~~TRINITY_DN55192_c0_g1_i1.p1  ORF type:complete len:254 (+),score=78.83 TRINITY_DN55192_c0_g1_i1:68-829(+)
MGAQACCSANAFSTTDAVEEQRVWKAVGEDEEEEVVAAGALRSEGDELEPKIKDCESEAPWSQASTGSAEEDEDGEASDAPDLCSSAPPASDVAEQQEKELESEASSTAEDVAEYDSACAVIKFQPDGPKGMGLLTVTFKPVPISPASFAEALQTLAQVTREYIHADFVTIFDISKLIVPSPFILPKLLGAVKENLAHLDSWREYQQAFSVVRGESSLFNAVVSALGSVSRAKNKPVFAKDQAEAFILLSKLP